MKRIRMNQDFGYWAKKGCVYDVSDSKARWLLSKHLKCDSNGIYSLHSLAELVEDLGRHIGQSKHTYDKNGPSKAFGPGQPPKEVTNRSEILQLSIDRLNAETRVYECKLCGHRNNPQVYAMTEIGGRWWHNFCLEKASWHTLKLIKNGQHDRVKMLKLFKDLNKRPHINLNPRKT